MINIPRPRKIKNIAKRRKRGVFVNNSDFVPKNDPPIRFIRDKDGNPTVTILSDDDLPYHIMTEEEILATGFPKGIRQIHYGRRKKQEKPEQTFLQRTGAICVNPEPQPNNEMINYHNNNTLPIDPVPQTRYKKESLMDYNDNP